GQGDVNAIGRVHDYLERIGAVNVGHVRKASEVGGGKVGKRVDEDDQKEVWITFDSGGRRNRRVRNSRGEWVDEKDLEGRTIDHDEEDAATMTAEERAEAREQRLLMKLNSKYFADEELEKVDRSQLKRKRAAAHDSSHSHDASDVLGAYDPFRLIPTRRYSSDIPTPFRVDVHSNTLIIMDFHAHLAHTEIIGLLGGTFDSHSKTLSVRSVFPCKSLSTGVQCEMDPESEMRARETFASENLEVVGWYHSHPTFEPNPSVRDVENQVAYQTLFQRPDGTEPFVGAIVSPYDPRNPLDVSRVKFLHVSQAWNSAGEYRIPYTCQKTIVASDTLPSSLFAQISDLVGEYRYHEHRVDLTKPYRRGGGLSRMDKLLASIGAHAAMAGADAAAGFMAR
ncbi:Myb-like, SWIRM and MPN domains 1, partial [Borealophlyctis nickersoniae]